MGMPENNDYMNKGYVYPNVKQQPVDFSKQSVEIPQQKAIIEHHSHNKIKEFVNMTGDFFGWGWLLMAIIIGAFVILSFIFREHLKKAIGVPIKLIDNFINRE